MSLSRDKWRDRAWERLEHSCRWGYWGLDLGCSETLPPPLNEARSSCPHWSPCCGQFYFSTISIKSIWKQIQAKHLLTSPPGSKTQSCREWVPFHPGWAWHAGACAFSRQASYPVRALTEPRKVKSLQMACIGLIREMQAYHWLHLIGC